MSDNFPRKAGLSGRPTTAQSRLLPHMNLMWSFIQSYRISLFFSSSNAARRKKNEIVRFKDLSNCGRKREEEEDEAEKKDFEFVVIILVLFFNIETDRERAGVWGWK